MRRPRCSLLIVSKTRFFERYSRTCTHFEFHLLNQIIQTASQPSRWNY